MDKRLGKLALTAMVSTFGGLLFHLFNMPLVWILGPALGIMILRIFREDWVHWPRLLGDIGIMIVSYALGRQLTSDAGMLIIKQLHWMVIAALFWFVLCLLCGLLVAKFTGVDRTSALLGSVPGGLAQMVYMAEQYKGADVSLVAILQTARLVVVLYTVPVLAALFAESGSGAGMGVPAGVQVDINWGDPLGYAMLLFVPLSIWVARKINMPAGELLGPLLFVGLCSMLGYGWATVPAPLMAIGQMLFGAYLGNRIQLKVLLTNRMLGPLAITISFGLMGVVLLLSWLLEEWTGSSMLTWLLSLAPGGLGEVSVTALVLGADVSHVITYQTVRMFIVLLLARPVIAWYVHKKCQPDEG